MSIHFKNKLLLLFLVLSLKVTANNEVEIGNIYISKYLIESIQYSTKTNSPRWDDEEKVWIYPSLDIDIMPTIRTANGQISIDINASIKGTANSGKEVHLRRNTIGASTESMIEATFSKPIYITGKGIIQGELKGDPIIQTTINTYNTFRFPLFSRIAHRRAAREAKASVQRREAKSKAELKDEIEKKLSDALNKVQNEILSTIAKITPTSENETPFSINLKSQNGNNGFIEIKLIDNNNKTSPPQKVHKNQAASSIALKEEALEKSLSKLLAGKEMRIRDLKKILCDSILNKTLNFCKKLEKAEPSDFLSILFDENHPVDIDFKNNNISIRLNAIYQIHNSEILTSNYGPLLRRPTEPDKLIYGNVPYVVEFTYALKDSEATLTHLSVRENKKEENSVNHFLKITRPTEMMNPVIKKQIESKFKAFLKDKIEYPPIIIPTKIKTESPDSEKREIVENGTLFSSEIFAKDGWFYIETYFCKNNNQALGISFNTIKDSNSNVAYIITEVSENSPAYFNGLKKGDVISGFGEKENEIINLDEDYSNFLKFISNKAHKKTAKERIIFLKGKDNKGNHFLKEIILCPRSDELT